MPTIAKLITGRALIAAAVVALLEVAKHMGLPVPDDVAATVNSTLDALKVLVALVTTGAAHNAEAPRA